MREVKGYRLKHSIGSAHSHCLNASYSFLKNFDFDAVFFRKISKNQQYLIHVQL